MDNKEIIKLEIEGIEIIQDENGNIINIDENEEVNSMGKGEPEEDEK
jgi:hypothetical protein